MRRIAWALLTLTSSVLCLCVVVLWPRSLRRVDVFEYRRHPAGSLSPCDAGWIFSLSGSIGVAYFRYGAGLPRQWSGKFSFRSKPDDNLGFYPQFDRFGFRWWDYRLPFTQLQGPGRTVGVGV